MGSIRIELAYNAFRYLQITLILYSADAWCIFLKLFQSSFFHSCLVSVCWCLLQLKHASQPSQPFSPQLSCERTYGTVRKFLQYIILLAITTNHKQTTRPPPRLVVHPIHCISLPPYEAHRKARRTHPLCTALHR